MTRAATHAPLQRLATAVSCVAACLLTLPSAAAPPQTREASWAPSMGVELGYSPERLEVRFPEETYQEDRRLWNSRLALGVDGRFAGRLATLGVRSVSEIGYGFVHHTGHGLLQLTQTALLEYAFGGDFALPFGLALQGGLDTSSSARSSLGVGVPLGIRFRGVELWYRPGFVVPLGSEDEPVFGGERQLSARPGLNWLDFGLRLRLGFLAF